MLNSSFIKSHDGERIFLYQWNQVANPIGVVQIFHGMAEHAKRYEDFAKFLNDRGFIVYADDHRGHGKTAKNLDNVGYIGEDGFDKIVQDEIFITKYIKSKYKYLPIFIFGHSFGSFVAQEYLNRYSNEVDGVILSGSAFQKGTLIDIGYGIATLRKTLGNDRKRDKFIDKMAFGSYNNKFKDSRSKFAWLSSNPAEVKKYEKDPYCGDVFTTNFYHCMFKGFRGLYKPEKSVKINKNTPVYVIAGDMDPVGNYGKSVVKLTDYYKRLNLKDISVKLYKEGRHEILNENNKKEVYEDVIKWINERV